jgi:two-component system response regulator FlrC
VFPLHIPALRERRGDILPLAELAIRQHAGRALTLADCAREQLLAHDWPGNVRELENLIQRSLILLTGSEIQAEDLAFEAPDCIDESRGDLNEGLRNREYQLIIDAMKSNGGKRTAVADTLGISPRSLRYKLARMREEGIAIPGESS